VYLNLYSSNSAAKEWRTVLVGGVGAGGRGFYALDVTCPFEDSTSVSLDGSGSVSSTCNSESFNDNWQTDYALWEFTVDSDPSLSEMGLTFSKPVIAKVDFNSSGDNSDVNGNGSGRWAAILNNGYNSATGKAQVYIAFLDGGLDGTWTEGSDFLVLEASAGGILTPSTVDTEATEGSVGSPNGLSSPVTVDLNKDGKIERIYAGDLKGQLWVWDISAPATTAMYEGTSGATFPWTVNLLFTATDADGIAQPITTSPNLARDSRSRAGGANIMVLFGTGLYLQESDIANDEIQTVYAVHDRGIFNRSRLGTVTIGTGADAVTLNKF
jgi:type IV pilus assembly protein PilY1